MKFLDVEFRKKTELYSILFCTVVSVLYSLWSGQQLLDSFIEGAIIAFACGIFWSRIDPKAWKTKEKEKILKKEEEVDI